MQNALMFTFCLSCGNTGFKMGFSGNNPYPFTEKIKNTHDPSAHPAEVYGIFSPPLPR